MSTPDGSTPDGGTSDASSPDGSAPGSSARAARRAQREAERAARAQRKADLARQRAMEAAQAGGLFDGMTQRPDADPSATGATPVMLIKPTAPATPGPLFKPEAPNAPDRPVREPMDPARARVLTWALAALSVVLLVVAGLAAWQFTEARDATVAEEQIANAPTEATDAAREIATQMFTYDHRTVDADLAAVRDKLTDPALGEFVEQSMPTVASAAKQQQATVYATVAAAAPQEVVDGDNVTVLVMLNRMVSTKDAPEAAASASRLSMKMTREGDTWKLSKLDAL